MEKKVKNALYLLIVAALFAWYQTYDFASRSIFIKQQNISGDYAKAAQVSTEIAYPVSTAVLARARSNAELWADDYRLKEFLKKTHGHITSAYRDEDKQGGLYLVALKKYKDPKIAKKYVAPAGESHHNMMTAGASQANDIAWPNRYWREYAHRISYQYGMYFPYEWEDWHAEFIPNSTHAAIAAIKNNIPVTLYMSVIKQESGWNYKAVSSAGAIGLTQVMPYHIVRAGLKVSRFRISPKSQVDFGAQILSRHFKTFGRWDYALAAYNAGSYAVKKNKGIPPYKQTKGYVRNIIAMANK
jgi:soluble lytic murein transglycosylase-like protein